MATGYLSRTFSERAGAAFARVRDREQDSKFEHLPHVFSDGYPDEHNEDCHWCALAVYERENPPELLIF